MRRHAKRANRNTTNRKREHVFNGRSHNAIGNGNANTTSTGHACAKHDTSNSDIIHGRTIAIVCARCD